MRKKFNNRLRSKNSIIYILLALVWLEMSTSCGPPVWDYIYSSPDGGSFTGTTSYCQGSPGSNSFVYTQCTTAGSDPSGTAAYIGAQGDVKWYYNTTGVTNPLTSTFLDSIPFTSPGTGAPGSVSYTPLTTLQPGTYYYFGLFTWTDNAIDTDYCHTDGPNGQIIPVPPCPTDTTYITPVQTINITGGFGRITGDSVLCVGDTVTLSDTTPGGSWSTDNSNIATVDSTGLVTSVSPGIANIGYTIGTCLEATPITVNLLPPAPVVSPTAAAVCNGGSLAIGSDTIAPTIVTLAANSFENGVPGPGWGLFGADNYYLFQQTAAGSGSNGGYSVPAAEDGHYFLEWNSWDAPEGFYAAVYTPIFSLTDITPGSAVISFWVYRQTGSSYTGAAYATEGYDVYITRDGVTSTDLGFVPRVASTPTTDPVVGVSTPTTAGWYHYTTVIPDTFTGPTNLIVFYGFSDYGDNVFMDNIAVTGEVPSAGPMWSPGNYLYTNAGLTTPYNPLNIADTVYTHPTGVNGTVVETYSATATTPNGCHSSGTSTITIYDLSATILGDTTICSGGTTGVAFVGQPGSTVSYNINNGRTLTAVIDSNDSAVISTGVLYENTTYHLLSVVSSACSATVLHDSAVITVTPSLTNISGRASMCTGSSTTLSSAPPGGTWSTGSAAIASVTAVTGIVDGISSGTTPVTYTEPTTGCIAVITATVNAVPSALSATTVCQDAVSYAGTTETVSGGAWSIAPTNIATVDPVSGMVSGINAGSAVVTYTLPGDCFVTASVTVDSTPAPITGTMSVCQGATTVLSDGSTASSAPGTWSSSNSAIANVTDPGATSGANTDAIAGVSAGTALISYTFYTGCAVTTTVTVNPSPAPVMGLPAVCAASEITLSDTLTGGTWSASPASVATIDPSSGILTGITPGTTIVTYTLQPGNCAITDTIRVDPIPSPITGRDSVCTGLTTSLQSTPAGGRWTSIPSTIATVNPLSGMVRGESAGTAEITYTLSEGCSAIKSIEVHQSPAGISGPMVVCAASSITLSDAPTTGGSWSTGSTSVASIDPLSGILTGISAGATIVTYTVPSGGCMAVSNIMVNPVPSPIMGADSLCTGLTASLSSSPSEGTWTSAPSGIAVINPLSGVVSGISAGTANVTYTLSTGCMATLSLEVNTSPTAIIGPSSVCVQSNISLSDAPTSGGSWSATPASTAVIDPSSGILTGVSEGSTVITYTLPAGGCMTTDTIMVNPLPLPITGTATVCAASSTALYDNTYGGTWSVAPASIASVDDTGNVTGLSAGTAIVSYVLGTGCLVTDTMTINPLPESVITPLGDTMLCPGGFVVLTASAAAHEIYQWYDDTGMISGATASSYIASSTGLYEVSVGNRYHCRLMSPPVHVIVSTVTATITNAGGILAACAGTTLSANTGAGLSYQWQLNGVSIAGATGLTYITQSPGDYTVIVSNSTGCSATSNTITVNPNPSNGITASGPLVFCAGSSVVLTASSGTGYVYQWYDSSVGAIDGANGNTLTATATNNYWVKETNSYGCSDTSAAMDVVATPSPGSTITAGGATTFCPGGSVLLSAPTGTGYTYQWYDNGVAIRRAGASTYLDTVTGDFTVMVTDLSGCRDSSATGTQVTVITNPAVVPLTPTSFCWGGSVTLSVNLISPSGGVTYQWYMNGSTISGATGYEYSTSTPGNYSCQIAIPGSCNTTTVPVTVTEFPLPNPVVTFDGVLFHTQPYYVTYQWYKNLVLIAGATGSSTPSTGDGSYAVAVTDTNGCQSISDAYSLARTTSGVGNVDGTEISIYPNPAQTMVHIESQINVRAKICAIDGREVISQEHAKDIDISSLADAVYMIMLYDDNGQMVKVEKLVKTSN